MGLEQELSNAIAQAEHYARVVRQARTDLEGLEGERDKQRAQALKIIESLGIIGLENQLHDAANNMMAAMRRKLELQEQRRADLTGEDTTAIEGDVTAEVEVDSVITAEERKAANLPKLPNNDETRRAEVLRRLAKHGDYQDALARRIKARNELAQVDMQFAIAEVNHKATRVVLESRVAQLKALTGI